MVDVALNKDEVSVAAMTSFISDRIAQAVLTGTVIEIGSSDLVSCLYPDEEAITAAQFFRLLDCMRRAGERMLPHVIELVEHGPLPEVDAGVWMMIPCYKPEVKAITSVQVRFSCLRSAVLFRLKVT